MEELKSQLASANESISMAKERVRIMIKDKEDLNLLLKKVGLEVWGYPKSEKRLKDSLKEASIHRRN